MEITQELACEDEVTQAKTLISFAVGRGRATAQLSSF